MVGTHLQLDAAVEIAIQRTVGPAAARTRSGNRVDLNLARLRIILQRALRRRAKQGKVVILHKEHVGAGVALLQHVVGCQR